MVIDPQSSKLFIACYSALLTEVQRIANSDEGTERVEMLTAARSAAFADPTLFDMAALRLEEAGVTLPAVFMLAE
jgi:hypothetical protein